MRRERQQSISPEERYQRAISARRKFRAIVRLIIANLTWLQEIEDDKLGDNVKKNIQVLTRKKGKKSLLTLRDKAVLNKPQEIRDEAEKAHLRRIIGNLKCFRRYPPEVKLELPGIMYFTYFGANRVIVKQGYEAINFYVILSGEVVVSQTYYDKLLKEEVTKDVLLMGPGSYFGEVGLLHNIERTATVTTTQPTEFLYIKRDDFNRVVKDTVASQWAEVQSDMSCFSYFDGWSEIDIRESCILAKKKTFCPDQIVLSSTGGQQDCVYFLVKGSCYLLEYMDIKTVMKKGLPYHSLVKSEREHEGRLSQAIYKEIKKLHRGDDEETAFVSARSSIRPPLSLSTSKSAFEVETAIRTHFIRVCTFNRLACFNVGENLKNRIIVAAEDTECLLLPRYFLMDKSMLTFKAIALFLSRHVPSTEKIFDTFMENHKWENYKQQLVSEILETKTSTRNTIHNVPYTIRLKEDLGEV